MEELKININEIIELKQKVEMAKVKLEEEYNKSNVVNGEIASAEFDTAEYRILSDRKEEQDKKTSELEQQKEELETLANEKLETANNDFKKLLDEKNEELSKKNEYLKDAEKKLSKYQTRLEEEEFPEVAEGYRIAIDRISGGIETLKKELNELYDQIKQIENVTVFLSYEEVEKANEAIEDIREIDNIDEKQEEQPLNSEEQEELETGENGEGQEQEEFDQRPFEVTEDFIKKYAELTNIESNFRDSDGNRIDNPYITKMLDEMDEKLESLTPEQQEEFFNKVREMIQNRHKSQEEQDVDFSQEQNSNLLPVSIEEKQSVWGKVKNFFKKMFKKSDIERQPIDEFKVEDELKFNEQMLKNEKSSFRDKIKYSSHDWTNHRQPVTLKEKDFDEQDLDEVFGKREDIEHLIEKQEEEAER